MRIHVVGLSGSGKTTLARRLSAALGIEHIELDGIHHQAGWTPLPPDAFRQAVRQRLDQPSWVVDGNYQAVRPLVWERVDTIVWLDLRRRVVFPALVARSLRRGWSQEELWNGNRENPWSLLSPRKEENLLLWAAHKWPRYQSFYGKVQLRPPRPGVEVLRIRERWQIDELIDCAAARWGA